MKGNNTMTKSVAAIQSDAAKLGNLFTKDSKVNTLFIKEVELRTDLKLQVARTTLVLLDMLDGKMNEYPTPDSGPEGNNPDVYEEAKGKGKAKRTGSFWGDSALSADSVRKWVQYKKELEAALSAEGSKDPQYEHLWKNGTSWVKSEKSMISQRITAAQNLLRNGARCAYKMARIEAEFTGINVAIEMDDDTNDVKRVTKHFTLWADAKDGKPQPVFYLSAGEFLALDLDKAAEKGGTIEAIIKSGSTGGNGGGTTAPEIKSVKTLMDTFVSIIAFSRDENNTTKLVNQLVKDDNKDEVKNLSEVYLYLDTILKGYPKVRDVYEEVTGQSMTNKGNKTSDKEVRPAA